MGSKEANSDAGAVDDVDAVVVKTEPFFFIQPTILVTGVKSVNDFLPIGNSATQCINRLTRVAIIVTILLALIFRSWWPIVTMGGAILLAMLISFGYQSYTKSKREQRLADAKALLAAGALSTSSSSSALSFAAAEGEGRGGGEEGENTNLQSQLLGDTRPAATTAESVENAENAVEEGEEEREDECDFDDASPILPDCAIDHRYEQIVDEQRRLYDREFAARDCIVARLEKCAPYDPTATIPQPSRRSVIVPQCQKPINNAANRMFSDGSCGRETAADKEERALANARLHGNPNVGRVSSMLGINAEQATLENLPNTYRKSSMMTDINSIYDGVQKRGPAGTLARTTEMETGRGRGNALGGGKTRPVHDPTETMINSMWGDSTEQNWKTQFLDRRPAPWQVPGNPTSRKLEEQAAASRSAYKSFSISNGY